MKRQQQHSGDLSSTKVTDVGFKGAAPTRERHTPGPWKDGPVFQREDRAIFWTDDGKPGRWQRRLDDKQGHFSAADARLIAAAPELLAALENLIPRFEACCLHAGSDEEFVKASTEMHRAALVKAHKA